MRNRNGIEIKECCASCRYRQINTEKGRFCTKHEMKVKAGGLCEQWALNPNLEHAGDAGGQVKCTKYLDYYRKRWLEQREAVIAGSMKSDDMLKVEQIRKEYNEQYGSEYIHI